MSQITQTDARNYDPALMMGFDVDTNDIGYYFKNCVTSAPGLQISGGSGSALVASTNTFGVRAQDIIGVSVTATNMPSLATALLPDGVSLAGNLAFDNGTFPDYPAAGYQNSCRMYTFLASVNVLTGAVTLSVVAGNDFPKHRPVNVTTDVNLGDGTRAIVGYLYVKNESSAVFTPNTTHLDASGITSSIGDAFGYMSYNAQS